jgi:hypothetical protein
VAPKKPKAQPPDSAPVWEAYRDGYAGANDGEPPPRNAATNAAIVRLVRDLGVKEATRLVADVFAVDEVRGRYPSILAIAKDPAAVRSALSSAKKPRGLTKPQLDYAREICKRHLKHPLVERIVAEKRRPTHEEFQELVALDKQREPRGQSRTRIQRDRSITPEFIESEEHRKAAGLARAMGLTDEDMNGSSDAQT